MNAKNPSPCRPSRPTDECETCQRGATRVPSYAAGRSMTVVIDASSVLRPGMQCPMFKAAKPPKASRGSLEFLLSQTEEVGECLEWSGSYTSNGYPQAYVGGNVLARRAVYQAVCCGPLLPGAKHPIVATCGNSRCVDPDHIRRSTTRKVARAAGKRGALSTLTRRAALSAAIRAKRAKLTIEQVREIRGSQESGPILAERFHVSRSLINRIKSGERWSLGVNPFAALAA